MCLTLFKKKIARDSLLVRALEFALKFMCSSKYMPSSLKDLRLGLAWLLWIRSISEMREGSCWELSVFESSMSFTLLFTFFEGT